jgi:hypothetical protein
MEQFSYREFQEIRDLPGIYAWYINFNEDNEVQNFQEFFAEKKFDIKLIGNLKENYFGNVRAKVDKFSDDILDKEMLQEVISSFNVPIYIGISKSLRTRLQQHKEALEEKLATGLSSLEASNENHKEITDIEEIDIDTLKESSAFAERLYKRLLLNKLKARDLSVRVVYFDRTYNKKKLFRIENFINRIFYPILGRN